MFKSTPQKAVWRVYKTKNGESLIIAMGDITKETVGVIVNAANEDLWLGAGVAGAIDRNGGPTIQKECYAWTKKHGSVPTGQCAYTSGGRMHAKFVVHAVGPIYKNGKNGNEIIN
jgi:O-acetyl-ADP-ribose deacetylase (regulator of RNase III)